MLPSGMSAGGTARELDLGQYLRPGYHGPWRTRREPALLGTHEDEVLAARVGRTAGAVRCMRIKRKVPKFRDRHLRGERSRPARPAVAPSPCAVHRRQASCSSSASPPSTPSRQAAL